MTSTSRTWVPPWDDGVRWRSVLVSQSTEDEALPVSFLGEQALRVYHSGDEDFIRHALKVATHAAEEETFRTLLPQTWRLVLDGFPDGRIVLPKLPLMAVTGFEYTDTNGDTQTLAVSPADFRTVPSGDWSRAELWPLDGESWPTALEQGDAVRITYTAGYETTEDIPEVIKGGIALMVGELYKQRTLSVHAVHHTPALLSLSFFWRPVH